MGKKKVVGYAIFVNEKMKELQRKHNKRYTFDEVSNIVKHEWAAMSPEDKNYYKGLKYVIPESQGNTCNPVCRAPPVDKSKEMKSGIKAMVNRAATTINSLKNFKFTYLAVSYYLKTEENVFFPSEISLVTASLKDGICSRYHSIIAHPPVMPMGYCDECRHHIQDTHHIPIARDPNDKPPSKEPYVIQQEICSYLKAEYPDTNKVVFTKSYELPDIKEIMDTCFEDVALRVWPLEQLYMELYQALDSSCVEPPDAGWVKRTLFNSVDSLDFRLEIVCDWHREFEPESGSYCTLNMANRWIYLTLRSLKLDEKLGITLLDEKHWPVLNSSYGPLKHQTDR